MADTVTESLTGIGEVGKSVVEPYPVLSRQVAGDESIDIPIVVEIRKYGKTIG